MCVCCPTTLPPERAGRPEEVQIQSFPTPFSTYFSSQLPLAKQFSTLPNHWNPPGSFLNDTKSFFPNLILLVRVGLWHLKNFPQVTWFSCASRVKTSWLSILWKVEALPLTFLWSCLLKHCVQMPCVSSIGSCFAMSPPTIRLVTTWTYNTCIPFVDSRSLSGTWGRESWGGAPWVHCLSFSLRSLHTVGKINFLLLKDSTDFKGKYSMKKKKLKAWRAICS